MFGELFSGALHKNPVIAPGQLQYIIFTNYLVNLFLTNLVRIPGFSLLFSAIAVFLALSGKKCCTAIARKREENPEILTKLVRTRLTRDFGNHFAVEGKRRVASDSHSCHLSGPPICPKRDRC